MASGGIQPSACHGTPFTCQTISLATAGTLTLLPTRIGHGQHAWTQVVHLEVLVREAATCYFKSVVRITKITKTARTG